VDRLDVGVALTAFAVQCPIAVTADGLLSRLLAGGLAAITGYEAITGA
jgi:hypothetical protein